MDRLLHPTITAAILGLSNLLATPGEASDARLRIVSFNVECLQAPDTRDTRLPRYRWKYARLDHLERVANVIETLEPHIICLIEVTSKASVDHLVDILKEKGLTEYRSYHVESADHFSGFDVAFITRIKADEIDGQAVRLLHSAAGDNTWREKYSFVDRNGMKQDRDTALNRHALLCVTARGRKLGLLGMHLKSDPSDAYSNARRTAETKIVQHIVQKEIVARGYTPILLGDMNDYDPDVPDRDTKRSTKTDVLKMLKDFDPKSRGPELVNAGDKIRRIADRYTSHWDINENGAADIGDVYTTIDYILLHKSLAPHLRRSFVCRLTDLKTSDHWPVVVDLDLPDNLVAKGAGR